MQSSTTATTMAAAAAAPIVYIVDDDAGMRKSTSLLLDIAGLSYKCFESASRFLDEYRNDQPGCLILDLHMPGMHGMELVRQLRERQTLLPIIIVTGTGTIPVAAEGFKLGIVDFLEKPVPSDVLVSKVKAALELDEQRRTDAAGVEQARRRLAELTPRERELLGLVVHGLSSKQIAAQLGISIKTVENHRASLMQKTGASNSADLVRVSMLVRSA